TVDVSEASMAHLSKTRRQVNEAGCKCPARHHTRRRRQSLQSVRMAIDFYWGSGSPPCWRVALALEYKGLSYNSHLLHFDRQEHKSPQMLAMNFRGRLPVLRDGDYVVFESLAILYYLDQKYPDPPIFGRTPEEAAVIMRVICEYLSYAEPPLTQVVQSLASPDRKQDDAVTDAMHRVAGEARSIEMRLALVPMGWGIDLTIVVAQWVAA